RADGPAGTVDQGSHSAKDPDTGTRRIRHCDAAEIVDCCWLGRPGGEDAVRGPLYLRARVVGDGTAVPDKDSEVAARGSRLRNGAAVDEATSSTEGNSPRNAVDRACIRHSAVGAKDVDAGSSANDSPG